MGTVDVFLGEVFRKIDGIDAYKGFLKHGNFLLPLCSSFDIN